MPNIPSPYSEFLREPNLLMPWKKPIGQVKVDTGHSIGGSVRYCTLDAKRNIAAGGGSLIKLADLVEERGTINGSQYFRNTSSATTVTNGWAFNESYPEFFGANERTFVFFGSSASWTSGRLFIGYGQNATAKKFVFRTDTGNVLRYEIGGSNYASSLVPPTNTNTFIAISTGATYADGYMYLDGVSEAMTGTATSNTETTANVAIGNHVQTTLGIHNFFKMYGFYGINRKLTIAEMDGLYRDPYQFLIPA